MIFQCLWLIYFKINSLIDLITEKHAYLNNSLVFSPKNLSACDLLMGTDINGLRECDERVKKNGICHKDLFGLKF